MENISILAKAECCGCTACYSICPTRAIKMSPDEEGFLYPAVDEKKCINCGLCLKTCKQDTQYKSKQKIYAIKSNDLDLRFNSSSGGGIFINIKRYN